MKKISFLLFVSFLFLSACTDSIATNEPNCSDYSLQCEMEKQYIFVDPIEYSASAKDAWGAQLDDGWYAINMDNPGILLPINTTSNRFGQSPYDIIKAYTENGAFVIDTLLPEESISLQLKNVQKIAIVYAGKKRFTFANSKNIHNAEFAIEQ